MHQKRISSKLSSIVFFLQIPQNTEIDTDTEIGCYSPSSAIIVFLESDFFIWKVTNWKRLSFCESYSYHLSWNQITSLSSSLRIALFSAKSKSHKLIKILSYKGLAMLCICQNIKMQKKTLFYIEFWEDSASLFKSLTL